VDVGGPVELSWPQLGLHATMRASAPTTCIVVASPPGRGAIAVEPETHAPQGIRRLVQDEPGPLVMLAPGDRLTLGVQLAFGRG
jgi:galactose mutarotase-like enzyme